MGIITFLLANWDSVVAIAVFIAVAIVLYKRGETKILETILFGLVTKAERDYGEKTGELKKSVVIDWLYEKMPLVLKLIITRRELEKVVDKAVEYAKKKWAANPQLQEYIKPTTPEPPAVE